MVTAVTKKGGAKGGASTAVTNGRKDNNATGKGQSSNAKMTTKDATDDESNYKNRTLRFTNNNFLGGGVTSGSTGFGHNPQISNFKVTFEGGWDNSGNLGPMGGRNLGEQMTSGNINDLDEGGDICESVIEEEIVVQQETP